MLLHISFFDLLLYMCKNNHTMLIKICVYLGRKVIFTYEIHTEVLICFSCYGLQEFSLVNFCSRIFVGEFFFMSFVCVFVFLHEFSFMNFYSSSL